jgi:hypothetical protein
MFVQKLAVYAAVLALGAIPMRASEVFLTSDPSALQSQPGLGSFTNVSFDGVMLGGYDSVLVSGVTFTTAESNALSVINNPGGSWPAGQVLTRSINAGEIDIALPASTRAFGASFGLLGGATISVTIRYDSGSTFTHQLNIAGTGSPVFLGFVSDAQITNLRFINDFNFSALALNNVMIADAFTGGDPEATPEPGTLLLIGGGLVSLRLLGRRRRRSPGAP